MMVIAIIMAIVRKTYHAFDKFTAHNSGPAIRGWFPTATALLWAELFVDSICERGAVGLVKHVGGCWKTGHLIRRCLGRFMYASVIMLTNVHAYDPGGLLDLQQLNVQSRLGVVNNA